MQVTRHAEFINESMQQFSTSWCLLLFYRRKDNFVVFPWLWKQVANAWKFPVILDKGEQEKIDKLFIIVAVISSG